jgi:hypothetical protein
MRPQSIIMFERLFLASLAIGVVNFILGYGAVVATLQNDPNTQQLGLGGSVAVAIFAVGTGIYLLLWYLIARKAMNIAKWILVALVALSVASLITSLAGPFALNATTILALLTYILEVAAVIYLFLRDAIAWLKGEEPADPATFD